VHSAQNFGASNFVMPAFFGIGVKLVIFSRKRDAMRAVELSISPFCTEFRCEQLCDDDIFWIGVKNLIFAPRPEMYRGGGEPLQRGGDREMYRYKWLPPPPRYISKGVVISSSTASTIMSTSSSTKRLTFTRHGGPHQLPG